MTRLQKAEKRITSLFLVIALLITMLPIAALPATAQNLKTDRVTDPSTMHGWKEYFPITGEISTENAGGVWMDKSVFTDASPFGGIIDQNDPQSFIVALSAIAANMSITGMANIPTDTMLVLDLSGSMNGDSGNNDVVEDLVSAANESIKTLLETNKHNRVGVVLYSGPYTIGGSASSGDAVVILPLGRYTTDRSGEFLSYDTRMGNNPNGNGWREFELVKLNSGVRYENSGIAPASVQKDAYGGTYIQKGVILAMEQFTAESNSATVEDSVMGTMNRKPVLVLMSDGAPTVGSTSFTSPSRINLGDGSDTSAALGFISQLSAAYAKAKIEEKYKTDALFYTLGLGISNNSVAISVLDPDNARASTAVDDFWNDIQINRRGQITFEGYNHVDTGETVSLGNNLSVTKISTPLEQNYVDAYFEANGNSGDLSAELVEAFKEIVNAIQLQSAYFPTLVSQSEDLSGYVSFVDRVGEYMSITDIKGILIDEHLFSGADLSSNFVAGGGELGTFDAPTALGIEMVAAVRARLGLDSDDTARTLIALAYENGQLSYTDENNYSNYIGWYANAAGEFLGFYNEGTTILPEASGNAATDPAFVIRSYGYLGEVDAEHGVSESDMMYATVQIRKNIATGEEIVTFAIPAALIPVITYNVTLDENGELSDLTVGGADNPIRLIYEVALDEEINSFNVKETVSADYLKDPHNVNSDGSVNFYTNRWEHENTTGYGTVNTYSYFNPSRQNDKYYYTEDAPVYSDANGTLYTGNAQPDSSAVFYRAYKVYKNNGRLRTETVYRELSDAAKATAIRKDDNTWYIHKGNVHVNLDGYTVHKSENPTATLSEASIPFVDTHNHSIDDEGYNFYVGATLGNNGKLTVIPETGIKLTKTMAEGTTEADEAFIFNIINQTDSGDNGSYNAWMVYADGSEAEIDVEFSGGTATVELNAGDTLYIGGMTAGQVFKIVEEETVEYVASTVGLSDTGTVTVNRNELASVEFINANRGIGNLTVSKEIEHDLGSDYSIPEEKTFSFEVVLSGIGTANATFEASHTNGAYSEITTDENGRFVVELCDDEQFEVFGLPEGTVATVSELNVPNGFTPAYYDNGVIGDGIVSVVADSTVSVMVTNTYKAERVYPVNVDISGNKTLAGREWNETDSFEFRLQKLMPDGSWQQLGSAAFATKESQSFSFPDAFVNESYESIGVYYYRVIELEPENAIAGVSYDKTVHSISVVVTDADMNGRLEIAEVRTERPETTAITETANGWSVDVSFTNTYSVQGGATVTVEVNKVIENLGGAEKSLAGYTFGLFDAESGEQAGNLLTTTERGFARFVLGYDASDLENGTMLRRYVLKEIAPASLPAGWEYSTEEYNVTVEAFDNGDGTISAIVYLAEDGADNATDSVSTRFINKYDPVDAELEIDFVNKELSGRDIVDGEFTFEVRELNGNAVLNGSNRSNKVVFDGKLQFNGVGTYHYNVVETSGDKNGVVSDKTVYLVTVNVTDANGILSASYVVVNAVGDTITFKNTYKASPAEHTIKGNKTLRGRTLLNDEFTFALTELAVDGKAVAAPQTLYAKNFVNLDLNVVFPTITYTKAGTYEYSVKEIDTESGAAYGINYDKIEYKVTVVVKDDGKGVLYIASESISLINNTPASSLSFVNEYQPKGTSAQFVGDKQLIGRVDNALSGGEFEFELYLADSEWQKLELLETVKNQKDGIIIFSAVDFETEEDGYFIITEKNAGQTINGITYDDAVYHVWVDVTDDLKGQLHATVHVYDENGIPQAGIDFLNIYEVTGDDSITLSGEKQLIGRDFTAEDEFSFELYETDATYTANGEAKLVSAMDKQTKRYSFGITYTADDAGKTFYYLVKEANAGKTVNGITYSNAEYRIAVSVTDNGNGGIETEITIENATASTLNFVNEYAVSGSVSAEITGRKELLGKELADNSFTFSLIESDSAWNAGNLLQSKQNVNGEIVFEALEYSEAGDYYYLVTEQNAGETVNGITYDDAVYRVHVKVTDELNGTLSRSVSITDASGVQAEIVFVNVYNVSGNASITLSGEKQLIGRDFTAEDEFSFELYETDATYTANGEAKLVSAMDKQTKRYSFGITYTADDAGKTFYYLVKEANAGKTVNGITYSNAEYRIAVSVTDNGNGGIDASVEAETDLNTLDFTNVYASSSVSIGFAGNKILNGRELKEGEFSFLLYNANESFELISEAIESAVNKTDGGFEFSQIEFTEAGIYRFVITENAENALSGVEYDNSRYLIAVSVADNGNGALEITETVMQKSANGESEAVNAIEFVNTYNAKHTSVSLGGKKVLVGRELEEGEFSFLLYNANGNFEIDDSIEALIARNGANGEFAFEAVEFTSAGIYRFVIVEDKSAAVERVSFDETVYLVQVEVIDDGNGSLVCLEPTVVKSGSEEIADEIVFTNVYTPKPENLTVDVNINKTVINKGSAIILPEGFEFLLSDANGDAEGISATSDSNGMAQITLSFSEADIGKVFSYKLKEVNSGKANVTYSEAVYEITVEVSLDEESNKLVADLTVNGVETDVIATAFENIYDYTPTPPPTGDNGNMFLWMIMMVISGGAAITLFATSKKKRASARM